MTTTKINFEIKYIKNSISNYGEIIIDDESKYEIKDSFAGNGVRCCFYKEAGGYSRFIISLENDEQIIDFLKVHHNPKN